MLKTMEIRTTSEEETIRLGLRIGKMLRPEDVVLLLGDLGAGKTRLAKGIVSAATGVSPEEVVSPSFTLINRFEGHFPVHHADLYRIEADQIDSLGLEEALAEGGALIVEWAEKAPVLDSDALRVVITYGPSEQDRRILIRWKEEGAWDDRIESAR
jgi:tRNA threonylcarbamoyladenosine biosynthesis protein TsaE